MNEAMRIIRAEVDNGDGLIVTFSDGTIGGFVVEELLALRPCRESDKKVKGLESSAIACNHDKRALKSNFT